MPPRVEVTKKYALAYGRASRKDKSRIQINAIQQELTRAASLKTLNRPGMSGELLDAVCAVTGWHRDHARKAIRRTLADQARGGPAPHRQREPAR